jgi:hypothetical protein
MRFHLLPIATGLLVAALPSAAPAGTLPRTLIQVGPGACNANNPANDTNLRRYPTGLRNVGTSTVSVVCTQWGDAGNAAAASNVTVYFRNPKSTGTYVTCTLTMGTPQYTQTAVTKQVDLPGADGAVLTWTTDDYGTNNDKQWANLQCGLPAGMVLEEIQVVSAEEIGA